MSAWCNECQGYAEGEVSPRYMAVRDLRGAEPRVWAECPVCCVACFARRLRSLQAVPCNIALPPESTIRMLLIGGTIVDVRAGALTEWAVKHAALLDGPILGYAPPCWHSCATFADFALDCHMGCAGWEKQPTEYIILPLPPRQAARAALAELDRLTEQARTQFAAAKAALDAAYAQAATAARRCAEAGLLARPASSDSQPGVEP